MVRSIRLSLWILALFLLWTRTAAFAADTRQITMNFKEAEIEAVVQFISEISGKNFILDEKVKGKVTVISPSKLTPDEAYEVFQAILNIKGFTIVPAGKVFKVVPTRDAKQTNIETVQQQETAPGDRFVTQILPLKHVEADTIASLLAPLVSKESSLVAYAPTNTLILTDSYSNIERLIEIIQAVDVETEDLIFEIIKLKYATADTMAKNLSQAIVEKGRGARRRAPARGAQAQVQVQVQAEQVTVKIVPDPRTNSLIVIGDRVTLTDIKTIIRALDVEMPKGSGKINVYYLKYADAENVAAVLMAISKSAGTKAKPGQPQPQAQVAAAKPPEVTVEFEQPVQITADKATNSLVIIASPQDFEVLVGVIEKLDLRRPQVLVETLVVEMGFGKSLELGVEWRTMNDPTSGGVSGFASQKFENGAINNLSLLGPLAAPSGLALGVVKGTIKFKDTEFLNIGALVHALQGNADVNILSTPHLLTTDNEEAEIIVSENIPFKTSEKFDSNGNPISTFEYRDVGLTLRVTPQINEDDFVKMKIFQEVSHVVSTATGGSLNAPTTQRRTAKTTLVAQDGSTIVIGGLINDSSDRAVSSVPCLGDLPVVGALFRFSSTKDEKRNLFIFITPHVIKTVSDTEATTRKKRDQYERIKQEGAGLPTESQPNLLDRYFEDSKEKSKP